MVSLEQLINLLNSDLSNEYSHMHFYLHSSIVIQGLHRHELGEFLLGEAQSEMKHVEEFGKLILGLGGVPTTEVAPFPVDLVSPKDILTYAVQMENEVVKNYAYRMNDAMDCTVPAKDGYGIAMQRYQYGRHVEIFLEDQINHSQSDAFDMAEMLKGL